MKNKRTKKFRKNQELEKNLKELNNSLKKVEKNIISQFKTPKFPVIMILGSENIFSIHLIYLSH